VGYTAIDNPDGVDINYKEAEMLEPKEELGIKELQELNKAVITLGAALVKQSKDGKISLTDLVKDIPEALAVIKESKDYTEIIAEIKDLDVDEGKIVAQDEVTIIFQIKDIIKNLT